MHQPNEENSGIGKASRENLSEILERLFDRDQEDRDTLSFARPCYKELSSLEERFAGTEFEQRYHYLLSFFALHEAQRTLLLETVPNLEYAKKWMKTSLDHALDSDKVSGQSSHWSYYIEGSYAYLQVDVPHLEHCAERCSDLNGDILFHMAKSLEATGSVNYKHDFGLAPRPRL